jgi:hypothetical protein
LTSDTTKANKKQTDDAIWKAISEYDKANEHQFENLKKILADMRVPYERNIQDMKAEVEGMRRQNNHFSKLYTQCLIN